MTTWREFLMERHKGYLATHPDERAMSDSARDAEMEVWCEQKGYRIDGVIPPDLESQVREWTAKFDALPENHPTRKKIEEKDLWRQRSLAGRLAEKLIGSENLKPIQPPTRLRPLLWRLAKSYFNSSFALMAPDRSDEAYQEGFGKYIQASSRSEEEREQMLALFSSRPTGYRAWTLARWFEQGCPVVHLSGHKFAAGLCATKPPSADQIGSPWRCWLLEIPAPLIEATDHDGKSVSVTHLFVHAGHRMDRPDGTTVSAWSFTGMSEGSSAAFDSIGFTLEEHLAGDSDFIERDGEPWAAAPSQVSKLNNQDERAMQIARRLALNACVAMSSLDGIGSSPTLSRPSSSKIDRGEPDIGVFLFGAPVKIDCRESVQAYIHGASRSAPTVRFPVRGHWKPRLSARIGRPVWVEPYWKGEGPTLIHDRVLGES